VVVLWLRRDLRLHDHPALNAAAQRAGERGGTLAIVFVFDRALLCGRHTSATRTAFLLEVLAELRAALRERGQQLIVRHGEPARELAALVGAAADPEVHATADVGPFAKRREREVAAALAERGGRLVLHPGAFCVDRPEAVSGSVAFTPFFRIWQAAPRRRPLPAPHPLPPPPAETAPGELPTLADLLPPLAGNEAPRRPRGGERAAWERLERFLRTSVGCYHERRNDLAADATSRLSPYLHFGCISARAVEERLPAGAGPAAFRRQLAWRDFYAALMALRPELARCELQAAYRTIDWADDPDAYAAWRDGRTGYPLVDAAMRQLAEEGWVHNRARLVAGSFLTKHLGIDWRLGERWYMRSLVDGDEASNNGNWQWIASVGSDPAPPARRILNPTLQAERFDTEGRYIRRYVPELASVPDRWLREPWRMPRGVQEATGCVIGRDYPAPIVDHRSARLRALERYRAARAAAQGHDRR